MRKIDVESIYDNQGFPNKTRFAQLPTKLTKGNLPVTFKKKIKSSGYGGKPESIKYSNTQKQKPPPTQSYLDQYLDWEKPFPLAVPPECKA